MRRASFSLLVILFCAVVAPAQDRVSLKPVFKAGDESRYNMSAVVETNVTPDGAGGLRGSSRRELSATVVIRTLRVTDAGDATLEATIETINFNSTSDLGGAQAPISDDVAGKTIQLNLSPGGQLSKCIIPQSQPYQILLDFILALARWYPSGDVVVGESWQEPGQGPLFSSGMSPISKKDTTTYRLISAASGTATIEGVVALSQNGTSAVHPGVSSSDVGLIAGGNGSSHIEVDIATGRVLNGTTESRLEGNLANTQASAEGEKPIRRTGALVETSKFAVKLLK